MIEGSRKRWTFTATGPSRVDPRAPQRIPRVHNGSYLRSWASLATFAGQKRFGHAPLDHAKKVWGYSNIVKKYVDGMYVARGSKVSLSRGNHVIRVWSNWWPDSIDGGCCSPFSLSEWNWSQVCWQIGWWPWKKVALHWEKCSVANQNQGCSNPVNDGNRGEPIF